MISVQSLKSKSPESKSTREDYVEKEQEKRSIVPLAFLLFLTGCAAYLKSFLPGRLEAQEDRQARKDNGADEQGPAMREDDAAVAAGEPTTDDATTDTTERTAKSSDNVVPIRFVMPQEIGEFLANDSPALDFRGMERPPSLRIAVGPVAEPVRPVNDNRSPGRSEDKAIGIGSGGGGGGGDDKHPRPRPPEPLDPVRNRPPRTTGVVHLQDIIACQTFLIPMLALLAGATDPDGDPLRITGLTSSSGTLTAAEDGWIFTRDQGMLGDVTLTYTISDGSASIQQTAHFRVIEAPPIIGTAADDNLLGTGCADIIDAGAGDDNIDAREGNDVIFGGDGADHIVAGAGNDIVHAGDGNDVVFAGAGNDVVFGGSGNDRLYGEDGNDTIYGNEGDDYISGGSGADLLLAGAGDDTVHGDAGNDTIDGGDGNDVLVAGTGNDVVMGAAGNDHLFGNDGDDVLSDGAGEDRIEGGAGDDHVVAAADGADDVYDGGEGQDTLDYSTATLSITVDLGKGTADGQDIGHDLIAAFEEVLGGSGDDHMVAGSTSVSMTGGKGRDTFEFQRSGDDPQDVVVRKITDFTVGDRIVAATYEISFLGDDGDGNQETIADMFDDIYLSQNSHRPVRFRFEKHQEQDVTFVDVHDRPDTDEFYSIEVYGHHHLQFTVAVA